MVFQACRLWAGNFDQCPKLSGIIAVGTGQYHRERDTLRFGDEVML